VKVAAAQRFTVLEHERVVGRGVQLARNRLVDKVERVEHRTVHLRHAP